MKTITLIMIGMIAFSYASPKERTYHNPVLEISLPDPSVIKADDGYFYLYATEDIRYTPVFRSKNLVDWEQVGVCFTKEIRPAWGVESWYLGAGYQLYQWEICPYLNKKGESMMSYCPNVILHGDSIFAGPGHNAEIVTDDAGNDWLLYHSFLKNAPEKGRVLCLNKVN